MTFHVKTTVFEGPLDLLLQLITKHQVEVTAVGLTEVVGEYVAFIDDMKDLDLEVTSEFLLIAATLIQLKAQSLLPTRGVFDLDEELALIEERDRLLSRLLVCVTFKDVAAVLQRRLQEANRFVPRTSGVDQPIAPRPSDLVVPIDVDGSGHSRLPGLFPGGRRARPRPSGSRPPLRRDGYPGDQGAGDR